MLIRAPGVSAPGVSKAPLSQVSLLPTLAELCGVAVPTPSDGKSFAAQLRNPRTPSSDPVFAEYNLGTPHAKYMLRNETHKYTFWTHDIPELYDLERDPGEMHNLALEAGHAKAVSALKEQLFAWYRPPEN
jgi:choline-sulfatase